MGQLEGRVALVTGGTKGIGRGIVEALLGAGAGVLATGITQAECTDLEGALGAGDRLATAVCDVRERASCEAAVAACVDAFGGLDVLAANAGVYPQRRLEDLTDEDLAHIVGINVGGMLHAIQAARPHLIASERGRIVVTSSITGNVTGYPGWSHYGATKAAQMGFVRTAAMEFAPHGVTVNAVLPGNVLTEGLRELGDEYLRRMAATVPLGYLGDPTDIGHVVAFLASDGARYVTGQGIVVDGGQILPESPDALADLRP